jgi:hypothetical protein
MRFPVIQCDHCRILVTNFIGEVFLLCKIVLSVITITSYVLNCSGKVKRIICFNLHSVSGLEHLCVFH